MIEVTGARLLYPSLHPPDFTPIETAFSKLKAPQSKAAEQIVDGLWGHTTGHLIDPFTPAGCANHFQAARYNAAEAEADLHQHGCCNRGEY